MDGFSNAAQSLARNPLSIIALFVVFIYYFACNVLINSTIDNQYQFYLILFVVIFPCLILGVFFILVTKYPQNLYSPQDFKDDKSYLDSLGVQSSNRPSLNDLSSNVNKSQATPSMDINELCTTTNNKLLNVLQLDSREVAASASTGLIDKIEIKLREKDYTAALDLASEKLATNPDDLCILISRAKAYALSKKYSEALTDLAKVIEKQHNNIEAHMWRCFSLGEIGRVNEAIIEANCILVLDSKNVWTLNYLALIYKNSRQYAQSLAVLNQSIEIAPYDLYIRSTRGEVLNRVGKSQDAINDANVVISSDASYYYAYAVRAEAYMMQGQYDDCIRDANEALRLLPDDSYALCTRAWAYYYLNRFEEVIQDTSEVLSKTPTDTRALRLRADTYRILSQLDAAVRDANRCLEVSPTDVMALRTRAEAFRRMGRFNEAIRDAGRSLEFEPNNSFATMTISLSSSGNSEVGGKVNL